ncbi:hypothetical protein HRI_001563400 [Hibiscus trionum]|uniref:B3 domain-containing protein n=1 Tax=Hibiscus trionum TaxID=183268 RepID=A0A9W7HKS4_HIBTR|nr:hypothetical protein HRI_001563400 [Hibiscus trionum]
MSNVENGYDLHSLLQKLKREEEQESYNERESLRKLTLIVVQGFVNRLVKEPTGIPMEKRGTKRENQDYLIHKQKKHKACNDKEKQQEQKIKKEKKKPNHVPKKGQAEAMQKFTELGLEPPPDMPEAFKICIQDMGGTEIKLVIQKFIRVTDLDPQQNRMSMPLKQVRCEFLNEAEKEKLSRREAIQVVLVEPRVVVSELNLNKWDVGKTSSSYVLNGPWFKNVVTNNKDSLKPTAVVQIWSFRVGTNSQLGFALVKVRDGEQD